MNSTDASRPVRIAVIGGGITGLSAAHRLLELQAESARPIKITLLEAGDQLGGVMGTREIDGYRIETAADSFITDKPWAVDLQRLGLAERLIPTDSRYRALAFVYSTKGKPTPVPEGFMLLAPAKIGPLLKSPLLSPWGKLRLGCEYFLPRGKSGEDESLSHFVRRRLGREVLDRIVQPLVGGIYTSDPEKLSLQATLPRFLEMEAQHRSLIRAARLQAASRQKEETSGSGARYGLFVSLRHGISELINALGDSISACDVRLQTRVSRMMASASSDEATLEFTDGKQETFDAVIPALHAHRAADLVENISAPLADELRSIEYASSAIVVTGHRLVDVQHPLDAFGLVIPAVECRKILAVSFTSRKFPDRAPTGCVQLRLLQHQHPSQPDQRLRLPLPLLCVSVGSAFAEGLRVHPRHDPRARARSAAERGDRDPRRRRPASSQAVRVVRRRHPHHPRNVAGPAHQGLDAGRNPMVQPASPNSRSAASSKR